MSTKARPKASRTAPEGCPCDPGPEADPEAAAGAAGLRYVSDEAPGLRREPDGDGFAYLRPDGSRVADEATLARIRSLAIPPAWSEVWVCPKPNGHLQATGRDAKGRKQYRYHPRWREARDEAKFGRMLAFGRALPAIRRRVASDLSRPGLPRRKVLAAVVRLLETTLIRVGNEEYARSNRSFGLTTLRDRHVSVSGGRVRFAFKGKAGVRHAIDLADPRLARVVRRCRDLPGQDLFQYLDAAGRTRTIGSDDVNAYLRDASGGDFTAKDFRTWAGTVLAALALREFAAVDAEAPTRANVVRAVEAVAKRLGNTPTICRKCYVHPEVIEAYLDGTLLAALKGRADAALAGRLADYRPEEAAVLGLLQQRLARAGDEAGARPGARRARPRRPRHAPRIRAG